MITKEQALLLNAEHDLRHGRNFETIDDVIKYVAYLAMAHDANAFNMDKELRKAQEAHDLWNSKTEEERKEILGEVKDCPYV